MGKLNLNFSEMQTFDPVVGGLYPIVVSGASVGTSKKAEPKIQFVLAVDGGENEGKRLWMEHSLQPHALFYFARTHMALTGAEISNDMDDWDFDTEDYEGLRAYAEVVEDATYDGTNRNQVVRLWSTAEGEAKLLEMSEGVAA